MTIDILHFKSKIEEELKTVIAELKSVGRINPDNPMDWESMPGELDIIQADRNEAADKFEEYENNTAILKQLEIRFNELRGALKHIEQGNYGICTVGGEEIERERLEANPAATTCIKHLSEAK